MENGKFYLITTYDWFFAPDGFQYKAIYGLVTIKKAEDILGFNPARSTNWFAVVTGETQGEEIIIAGCQINYAIKTNRKPYKIEGFVPHDKNPDEKIPLNKIYFP